VKNNKDSLMKFGIKMTVKSIILISKIKQLAEI